MRIAFGAALLLLLYNFGRNAEEQSHTVHNAFGEVEWVTIFFFTGLFVVVAGVERAGHRGYPADPRSERSGLLPGDARWRHAPHARRSR